MNIRALPGTAERVLVPPIKCQGIKTKLVNFILENVCWAGEGRWIEPFLGSGVVLFNVQPGRAVASDTNPHIIAFYQSVFDGSLSPAMVREHLTREGERLLAEGEDHYYRVRDRFNCSHAPLDFLFLNRSCFNGLMRFNSRGEFNVPFCRKPDRFRRAYVTKIVNQVASLSQVMKGKEWEFRVGDWRATLNDLNRADFVYLDPPYSGRHTDYFDRWSPQEAADLAEATQSLPCGVALSMWKQNKYRSNPHLDWYWDWMVERTTSHFYHVGSTEDLRNEMEEALLIKPGYVAAVTQAQKTPEPAQMAMAFAQ